MKEKSTSKSYTETKEPGKVHSIKNALIGLFSLLFWIWSAFTSLILLRNIPVWASWDQCMWNGTHTGSRVTRAVQEKVPTYPGGPGKTWVTAMSQRDLGASHVWHARSLNIWSLPKGIVQVHVVKLRLSGWCRGGPRITLWSLTSA